MARIAGVNIPSGKPLFVALQYVYGIGLPLALDICSKAKIEKGRRVFTLSEREVLTVRELIDTEYKVEGDLRRQVAMDKKRLMDFGCYRGLRHRKNLPARGQRTHSNARTRKGKSRAVPGKKG